MGVGLRFREKIHHQAVDASCVSWATDSGPWLRGMLKVILNVPEVSATGLPTCALLKLTFTVSPGWKPVPVAVTAVPGGPCCDDSATEVPETVKFTLAEPRVRPVASTGYCPLASVGTLNWKFTSPCYTIAASIPPRHGQRKPIFFSETIG